MTTIKNLISAVALIAASTSFAQSSGTCSLFPKGEDGPGVIGKRYAEGYLSIQDVSGNKKNILGTGVNVNLPIVTGIDITGGVGYSSFKPNDYSTTLSTVGGGIKLYKNIENDIKPFVAAGLGYTSGDVKSHSTNWALWNIEFGAEFPYKWISVTPSISYRDDFRHHGPSTQSFNYAVNVSSWIAPHIGIYMTVACEDPFHDSNMAPSLIAGARVRF